MYERISAVCGAYDPPSFWDGGVKTGFSHQPTPRWVRAELWGGVPPPPGRYPQEIQPLWGYARLQNKTRQTSFLARVPYPYWDNLKVQNYVQPVRWDVCLHCAREQPWRMRIYIYIYGLVWCYPGRKPSDNLARAIIF